MDDQSCLIIGAAIIGAIGAVIGGLCSWYGSKKAIAYQLKENQIVKRKILLNYLIVTLGMVSSYKKHPSRLNSGIFLPSNDMWMILPEASFTEDEQDCIAIWILDIMMLKEAYIDITNIPGYSELSEEKKDEGLREVYDTLDEEKKIFEEVSNIIKKYKGKTKI